MTKKRESNKKKLTVCRFVLAEKTSNTVSDAWNGLNTAFHNSVSQVEQRQLSIVIFFPRHFAPGCKKTKKRYFWSIFPFFSEAQSAFSLRESFFPPAQVGDGIEPTFPLFLFFPPPLNEMSIAKGEEEEKEEEATSAPSLLQNETWPMRKRERRRKAKIRQKKLTWKGLKKGGKDCWWCEAVFLMYSKKFSAVCCPEGIFPPFFLQASLLFLTVFPGKQIPLEAKVGGDIGGGGGGQKVAKTKKRGGGAWKKKLDCRKCRLPPSSSSSSSLAVETFLGGFIREREGGKGGGAKSGREKNVSLGDQSLPLLYRFSFPFSKLRILSFQYNITHFPIFFSEKWDSGYHEESESKVSQKMDKGKTTVV